jgi:hypothetical protein
MTGRDRPELAKAFDLLDRHGFVAKKIKERVKQHRAVAGGEHEAIPIRPSRIGRVEFQKSGEQHRGDVGRAHRQTGMSRFGLLHSVHGQCANGIGYAIVLGARKRFRMSGGGNGRRLGDCTRRGKTVRLGHDACNGTRNGACDGNLQSRRDARCRCRGNRRRTDNTRSIQVNSAHPRSRRHAQGRRRGVDVFPRYDVSFSP